MTSITDTLKLITGKRWRFIAVIFAIEIAMILVVSNSPFLPGELATYESQYNSIQPVLNQSAIGQVVGIFGNNFRVAAIELIPVIGPAIFGFSIYATARVVEVIAIMKPEEGIAGALATLLILPSTWLELPAYAIAVTESLYLVYSIFRGWSKFVRELGFLIVNVMLVAGVLIVAATFEVTEIQLEGSADPLLALLTWLPFAVVFAGVLKFWRISRRDAPLLEGGSEAGTVQPLAPGERMIITPGSPVLYCPNCGTPFRGSPRFCSQCGSPLPIQAPRVEGKGRGGRELRSLLFGEEAPEEHRHQHHD